MVRGSYIWRANEVCGSRVGVNCNLEKSASIALRYCVYQQSLGKAGHSFEKYVSISEQPYQNSLDQGVLADDHFAYFVEQPDSGTRTPVVRVHSSS